MGLLQNLTGWHALILLAVVLLFFGATKLPGLAKSVGQSMKIFKTEVRDGQAADDASAPVTASATAPLPAAAPVAVASSEGRRAS